MHVHSTYNTHTIARTYLPLKHVIGFDQSLLHLHEVTARVYRAAAITVVAATAIDNTIVIAIAIAITAIAIVIVSVCVGVCDTIRIQSEYVVLYCICCILMC